ncbi:MAG TPA: hypothetical protein PLA27_10920 [Anaerolineales bacterium]|jgi:hypothetical protein|nr:hypothetical protein [Anaerolineales bacterium]
MRKFIGKDYKRGNRNRFNQKGGSLGIAVIVTPAVALLAGGSATAAGTGGSSRQLVKTQKGYRSVSFLIEYL